MKVSVRGLVHAGILPSGELAGVDGLGPIVIGGVAVEIEALLGFQKSAPLLAHTKYNLFLVSRQPFIIFHSIFHSSLSFLMTHNEIVC